MNSPSHSCHVMSHPNSLTHTHTHTSRGVANPHLLIPNPNPNPNPHHLIPDTFIHSSTVVVVKP